MRLILLTSFIAFSTSGNSQGSISSFVMKEDVKVTIDQPSSYRKKSKTIIIFYALPNGNTTEQTMGKKLQPGDDWHFDIQHIKAQTEFIRKTLVHENIVVIYLENSLKAWPAWKQKHADHLQLIQQVVDSLYNIVPGNRKNKIIYLNGHSGGGSFIFGFLKGVEKIPDHIERISFIDSNYGYDSSYFPKIRNWLLSDKKATLTVFAYNDSVALYNGKPVVSATGGTWYRSHMMMNDLFSDFAFQRVRGDSITSYISSNKNIGFFFKENLNRGIYHTQQVELNGFIHSILFGTKNDSRNYSYYGGRAYQELIR